jgi:hypothetical protein
MLFIVPRILYERINIATPIADLAAATVNIKIEKFWP